MHKSTKNGDTEVGILKVVFCGDKSCLYFSYNNFEGIKRVVLVEISLSLENANILLSIAGLLSQKGKDVSEELPEDFVKYIGNLRRIFESLLPTKPRFQRSEREVYAL